MVTNDVGARPAASSRARPSLLYNVTLALLGLGTLVMIAQVVDLRIFTTGSGRDGSITSQSGRGVQDPLWQATSPVHVEQRQVRPRTKAPYIYRTEQIKRKCYAERDVGIIPAVPLGAQHFCAAGGWDTIKHAPMSGTQATKVTRYKVPGGISSTTFQNLMLDFVDVHIHKPISSLANDGGAHDPRFKFNPKLVNCACDELASSFRAMASEKERWSNQIWEAALVMDRTAAFPNATACAHAHSLWDFVAHPFASPDPNQTIVFDDPVVLIARHDDHNPFFQVSYALNAWIMLQGLQWDRAKTHVIHLDGGYASPIDALHRGLLAPYHDVVDGTTLMGKRVHFRGDVLLAPYELSGPMMQHLNDEEPCYESSLLTTFRAQCLVTQNVTPAVERALSGTSRRQVIVTVITRRPYYGRSVQRQWVNEDEILRLMQRQYRDLHVWFRSVEYVNLTLAEQMKTTIESDVIIGMHGAGLVNVLWTRPMTTVIEIFPKERRRWGYRNLCQWVGCDWHEFRGGEDLGDPKHPNGMDKRLLYREWMTFFKPLFRATYDAREAQYAGVHGQGS